MLVALSIFFGIVMGVVFGIISNTNSNGNRKNRWYWYLGITGALVVALISFGSFLMSFVSGFGILCLEYGIMIAVMIGSGELINRYY